MATQSRYTQKSIDFIVKASKQKKSEWLDKNREEYEEVLVQPTKELITNIAKALDSEPDTNARIRALYRKVLARDPSPKETEIAKSYLAQSDLPNLAHVLLSTNEVMFQK